MDTSTLDFSFLFQRLPALAETYWVIPAGLIALYFYGVFHFNTPDYDVTASHGTGLTSLRNTYMLSLAPPRFTTTRRRYRRYALSYVFLLQIAFLGIVFAWSAASTAGQQAGMTFPTAGDLQTRAIWALFALTGLLSSFPVFKNIDTWLLKFLHIQAMIPGAARVFAEELFEADFMPKAEIVSEVRRLLMMRDTIRVSDGNATGSLEMAILKTLWLKQGLEDKLTADAPLPFRVRMDRELVDIKRTTQLLVGDVRRYLAEQTRAVDVGVSDIDEFFETPAGITLSDLKSRRNELISACEAMRFRLCVLLSLFINVTTTTPESASQAVQELGFRIKIVIVPKVNLEALAKIACTIFVVILLFNTIVITSFELLHVLPQDAPHSGHLRRGPFVFSLIATLLYGFIIAATRALKKMWVHKADNRDLPQNVLTALLGYGVGVTAVFCIASFFPRGTLQQHAQLAASQLQLAVAGWFAGLYVDREIERKPVSLQLAGMQGLMQFIASLIGVIYIAPDHMGTPLAVWQQMAFSGFIACQNAIAGFVLGYMIQRLYFLSSSGDVSAGIIPIARAGDMSFMQMKRGLGGVDA